MFYIFLHSDIATLLFKTTLTINTIRYDTMSRRAMTKSRRNTEEEQDCIQEQDHEMAMSDVIVVKKKQGSRSF